MTHFRRALITAIVCGCTAAGAADGPTSPPPPLPPGVGQPATVWVPGHWDWNGSAYVWHDGVTQTIATNAPVASVWIEGRWAKDPSDNWTWIPAHFEQQGPSATPPTIVVYQPPPPVVVVQQPAPRTVYVTEPYRPYRPPVQFGLSLWLPLFGGWHHHGCR